jgi:hypothetical protein
VANLGLGAAPQRPAFAAGTDIYGNDYRTASAPAQKAKSQDRIASEPGLVGSPVAVNPAGATDIFKYTPAVAQTYTPITPYGPVVATSDDPYNQRYAAAADAFGYMPTDRAIMPANTEQTPAEEQVSNTMTGADIMPQYDPKVVKAMEPIAKWAADKLNTRVAPSQQDSWLERADNYLTDKFGTPGPNSPYARQQARMNDVAGRGERQVYTPPPPAPVVATPQPLPPPPPAMPQLPPYVNYQQLPTTYSGGVAPSQPITDYIYGGYASGGSVSPRNWDRIDAAIRLAKLFS